MKRLLFLVTIIMLVSCYKQEASISQEQRAHQDSLALHVSVMPVADCMPIYYAEQVGIFDSLGLDVRLIEYLSQMDCDTAVAEGHVQLSYTDLPRLILMNDSVQLCAIMQCPGQLKLVGARSKRFHNLKQLKERMVALDRHSTSDYWSDQIMQVAGLVQEDIYRPQINDVQLRTKMLCGQQIDASLLPEPYAEEALERGQKELWSPSDSTLSLQCFVMPRALLKDTMRVRQISLFIKGYNEAVCRMNEPKSDAQDSLHVLLFQHFDMQKPMADTLHLPTFCELFAPKKSNLEVASNFLKGRGRLPKNYSADSMLSTKFWQK